MFFKINFVLTIVWGWLKKCIDLLWIFLHSTLSTPLYQHLRANWIAKQIGLQRAGVGGASKLLSLFQILQIVDILSIYMYHILSMGIFTCY